MRSVGVRELRQQASALLAEVQAGEVIMITDRGRPVAQLVPLPPSRLAGLIAAGLARAPVRSWADLGPTPAAGPGEGSLTEELRKMRSDERY